MNEFNYLEKHMGTTVSLSLICDNQQKADGIAKSNFDLIKQYENIFSRFLPDSELSILNKNGSGVVSEIFITILKRSLSLSQLTNNIFNPLVQVETLGYHKNFDALSKQIIPIKETLYSTDINLISIEENNRYVSLGQNQRLDFGGILKGYLANILAEEIIKNEALCTGCIINIGGDITTRGYDSVHEPFIFLLYNPITGEEMPVTVTNSSIATSGTYARAWKTNSGAYHHIIDSHSLRNPKSDFVSASIIAKDGALTEALTKLFLIKGLNDSTAIVPPDKYQYQYFIVSSNGATTNNII